MKKTILIVFLVFFNLSGVFGQYEILLIDGRKLRALKVEEDSNFIKITKLNHKNKIVDTDEVFAIIKENKDTNFLIKNYQNIDSIKNFVLGEEQGLKYNNNVLKAVSFGVGVIIPLGLKTFNMYSFISPLVGTVFVASFCNISHKKMEGLKNQNPYYLKGYKISSQQKKIKQMAIYTTAGMIVGIGITYAFSTF